MSLYNATPKTKKSGVSKGISSSSSLAFGLELNLAKDRFEKQRRQGRLQPAKTVQQQKSILQKQNKGVTIRDEFDKFKEKEESIIAQRSHEVLQSKAKRYEALKRGEIEPHEESLVSFDSLEADDELSAGFRPSEYDVGRTRIVEHSQFQGSLRPSNLIRGDYIQQYDPDEALAERIRAHTNDVAPEHYDATKEVRAKGVGFYQFAKDRETRKQQMQELSDLRKQTETERYQQAQCKRKELLEERKLQIESKRLSQAGDKWLNDAFG